MSTQTQPHTTADPETAIQRIAAAVDSTDEGRDAAALANALRGSEDADVMLIGIEPDLSFMVPYTDSAPIRRATLELLSHVRDELSPEALIAADRDISIARGIERVMRENRRDSLVVGSGHRAADGQVSIGHTTRQLMHDLPCPLAIAPRGLAGRRGLALRRIAVGYDGGRQGQAALAAAGRLAQRSDAELVVRGVVDDRLPQFSWARTWLAPFRDEWQAAIDAQVAELRTTIEEAVAGIKGSVSAEVTRGAPGDELAALSDDVDLIVIGSRRWGIAARLLLGGTGEALGRASRAPLLIVPAVGESTP